jgi:hypothetical protein
VIRLVCILLVAAAGCSAAVDDAQLTRQQAELDEAVATWRSGDRSDYSYVYIRTCSCVEPEPQGPNTVFVVDGDVDVVEHFGSREALEGFSAEELFERIREAIDDGREIAVTYDEATGLPSSLNLDLRAGPDDDPLILEVQSFLSYAEHLAALADARALWKAAGLDQYQIRYEEPSVGLVEVDVRDGVATASTGPASFERTVTDFFDELDAAIAQRPDVIVVEYDSDLGYPTSYRIEQLSDRRIVVEYDSIEVTA